MVRIDFTVLPWHGIDMVLKKNEITRPDKETIQMGGALKALKDGHHDH